MFTPRKIILGTFSILILFILIYNSYIFNINIKNEGLKIQDISKKDYSIEKNNGQLYLNEEKESGDNISVNYLNYADKIIKYGGNLEVDGNNIKLEKGNFLVDIGTLSVNYNIGGTGFNIKNNGPSSFYIDNSESKIHIISLNNTLELELLDQETGEKVNTIYLYPNEFISILPFLNKTIKGSDLLRITQIFLLDILNTGIIKDGKINKTWRKKIFFGKEYKKDRIEDMFLFLYETKKEYENTLKIFVNDKKITIAGENRIIDNMNFFINNKKKKIYYKNLVIKKLGKTLGKKNISNLDINEILGILKKIKEISTKDYNEVKDIILYYSSIFIQTNKNINNKITIYKFFEKLNGNKPYSNGSYSLKLHDSFYRYNFHEDKNIYLNIADFTNKYENLNYNKPYIENQRGYFVLFLNKIILYSFENINNGEDINLEDIISIISNYTNLSVEYYNAKNEKDIKKKSKITETGIKNYSKIIKELSEKIRNNYFKKELSRTGILIKKGNINKNNLNLLQQNLKKIYNFIIKNIDSLEKNILNINLKKDFYKNKNKLDEYLEALNDYEKYLAKYEQKNKKFISSSEKNTKNLKSNKLNISDAKIYLAKFNNINLSNTKIDTRSYEYCYKPNIKNQKIKTNKYCYEIKNLKIGNITNIDFLLFPYEEHKITNIKINGDSEKNKGSYSLDIIQENLKGKNVGNKNYNFKDFFYLTFVPQNNYKEKEIFEIKKEEQESPFIRSIKNGILLGTDGTFNIVKDYLDIKYNNIIITENEELNDYDIKIKNVELNYKNGSKKYEGIFNSRYIFERGKTNSFKNLEVKFKNTLNENPITFIGVFPLDKKGSFRETLKYITIKIKNKSILDNISSIVTSIEELTGERKVSIKYNKISNNIVIKSKKVEVGTDGRILKKVIYNGKNILTKEDKVDNLSVYFNN